MRKPRDQKKTPPPAAPSQPGRWDIIGLFFLALALRIIGIGWGLPNADHLFSYHPDEIFVLQPALKMLAGDWNPHFFNYGTLYLYLVGIASYVFSLMGMSPADTGSLALLHLIGRMITAVMGAGTVVLVYLIGRDIRDRRFGLLAGLVMAIIPLHLVNSHFATVDVPATFFLMLGSWACVRLLQNGKLMWYLLAGAAMGFAMATKYTLAFGILLVLGAHFLQGKTTLRRHGYLMLALLMFPLFFLIGNPYALSFESGLHIRDEFLRGVMFESQHMQETRTAAFVGTGSGWSYHALRGMPAALGWPLYIVALAGLLISLAQWRQKKEFALLGLWAVVFFLIIGFATERFIRYLVPLMPFMALFAATAIFFIKQSEEARRISRSVLAVTIAVVFFTTAVYSISQFSFIREDPRDKALAALRELQPQTVGIQEPPWFRTPPVSPFNAGAYSNPGFEQWQHTAPYRVVVTGWSKDSLEKAAPDVFVLSDLQCRDNLRLDSQVKPFLTALDASYNTKQQFRNPSPAEWIGRGMKNAPPDWLYLKPEITLYSHWRLKK